MNQQERQEFVESCEKAVEEMKEQAKDIQPNFEKAVVDLRVNAEATHAFLNGTVNGLQLAIKSFKDVEANSVLANRGKKNEDEEPEPAPAQPEIESFMDSVNNHPEDDDEILEDVSVTAAS